MKTFTATPEEFATGQAFWKARDIIRPPRKPAQKRPPPKPLARQVGTITPEQFARGDAYWTGLRRQGHRTKPSAVIKPMAEDIVSTMLDEAMNRREFFGRLATALAGMALVPAAAAAPAAAAPAAAAPAAAAPVWTVNMQRTLAQIASCYVDEQLSGFSTTAGQSIPAAAVEEVKRSWARQLPKFKAILLRSPAAVNAHLGLTKSPQTAYAEPISGQEIELKDQWLKSAPQRQAQAQERLKAQELQQQRLEQELKQQRVQQRVQQQQTRQRLRQQGSSFSARKGKRVWPPRQQQGREEPWTDVDTVPESAAGLATWLLEAEVWSPDWQPSPGILAWFVRLLSSLKDGATWVSPGSGHVYRISHDDKEVILLHGDEHDPGHWHDMNRRTIQALGWTMIDKEFWDNYREEDDDENEFGDSGEQLSFAEGITVAEAFGATEDGPEENDDWGGETWKSEEDLERDAVEQGEQASELWRSLLPPEKQGLLDKPKLSPSPEQRKKSDDLARQCREAADAFNKMNERLLSSISAVAPSVQWLPEGDEEDDFPVKPVVATKVVGQVYLTSGLIQGGTRDGEVVDPKAVAKLCAEYGIEVLQLVHQDQSRSTIADRLNTIGIQNDLANALSAKYRPLWKSAMNHDEAVTLSTMDDDYWLSVTFSARDPKLEGKAQWFVRLVRSLKQALLRLNWPVRQSKVSEGIAGRAPEVYPSGFTAERAGDVVEWRFDTTARAYRFSKFWTDEWTGKQRKLENGALVRKATASEASVWMQQEMRRWRGGGWKVTPIGTSTQA